MFIFVYILKCGVEIFNSSGSERSLALCYDNVYNTCCNNENKVEGRCKQRSRCCTRFGTVWGANQTEGQYLFFTIYGSPQHNSKMLLSKLIIRHCNVGEMEMMMEQRRHAPCADWHVLVLYT